MTCIGCGAETPIPVRRENRGPYCRRCSEGRGPRPVTGFPTAFSCWGPEEHGAIDRVLVSGRFTMGEEVAAFEREFADWHGMAHGIMVNSGSSANLVAVATLSNLGRIRAGDKVLVPALAWSTTYAPLVQYGLDLVLVDCDDTWNASVHDRAFDSKATLIVACSILGNPANLEGWRTAAGVIDATLIEDNCESLGALTPDGKRCGTFGLMSTFSVFWSHQVSAIEGGMILTNDDECAAVCRMLRAHGWSRDVDPPQTFQQEYDFRAFGYNVRPLEMHAAIAREQLKKLPEFIRQRQYNLRHFWRKTLDIPGVTLPDWEGENSPFGLHFMVPEDRRSDLVATLRLAGIDCRLPTGGSFRLHPYGKPWASQRTPKADRIHTAGLFLGNGPMDLTEKIDQAVGIIREVLAP